MYAAIGTGICRRCGYLHLLIHDNGAPACLSVGMLAPCPDCGHPLWVEDRGAGAFDIVVYFDDEERSGSYAEPVTSCPTCHSWCGPRVSDPAGGLHHAAQRG